MISGLKVKAIQSSYYYLEESWMRTSFKEIKEDVLSYYEEMLEVAKRCDFPEGDTSIIGLKAQAEKIKEDRFCLVIAGEAKSGKSTFINAYLGTDILPMDVKQCTSAVVEIAYGAEFCLKAMYADGRITEITEADEINDFLIKNAALDDKYRDIPVPLINNEVIVKYKNKKIPEVEIKDLLEGVKRENIHRLSEKEYNKKIRDYIKEKQQHWKDVVVKIEILYPFEDISMKGIRIIDSPGVNAAGRVGETTSRYIESADAIMFLRPITGVAIEANSFKEFLESKSVDRNKNAMFLVLTRTASESQDTIARAYEEFVNMFGIMKSDSRHGIVKEQIIPVDSKAELYFNRFSGMSTPEISEYIKKLRDENKAEPFLRLAWSDACGDKEQLQEELRRLSNFDVIDQALNKFGRKAQYIALSEFLERIQKVYGKIAVSLRDKIHNYSLKAEDPYKLAVKITETQAELTDIENRLYQTIDEITKKYARSGKEGLIYQEAEKVMKEYREEIEKLNADNDRSIDMLEKISFRKVDRFIEFENELQKKVVAECNKALKVALSDKTTIEFTTLEPDFTLEMVEEIKKNVKKNANERIPFETGKTFKRTEYISSFSQKKYFFLFRNSITEHLDEIKKQAVRELRSFVSHTVSAYSDELAHNAKMKRKELEEIKNDKKTADELYELIARLRRELSTLEPALRRVEELKGGIDSFV